MPAGLLSKSFLQRQARIANSGPADWLVRLNRWPTESRQRFGLLLLWERFPFLGQTFRKLPIADELEENRFRRLFYLRNCSN
jgi:hypothetical protein